MTPNETVETEYSETLRRYDLDLLRSGHQLGNFNNYYNFNPVDERMKSLKPVLKELETLEQSTLTHLDVGY